MNSFLLVLSGLGGGAIAYFIWKKASKWYHWPLAIGLYMWICFGFSFVYINSIGYHHQAANRGGIVFGLVAVAWAFITARAMGYIGKKKLA